MLGRVTHASSTKRDDSKRPRRTFVAVLLITVALVGLFILWQLPRAWGFVLPMRLTTVGALAVAGITAGVSTVVFHTLTRNHILTPGLIGFDSIYVLINTLIVFFLGSGALSGMHPIAGFVLNTVIMVVFAVVVFSPLVTSTTMTLDVLLLIGVVCGIFFRSLAGLLQKMIDPNEYQVLQDAFFASFTGIDRPLLVFTLLVTIVVCAWIWHKRHVLDVMALGQETSIGLGVGYRKESLLLLAAITILVAASTALVGPILFLGIIVAHLAYRATGTTRHTWTLPVAALFGVSSLVGAQFILGQILGYGTTVSVLIEFVGGILFLFLLLRKEKLK